ncbi:MAG: pantothenate kinase, partial [Gemmatimonadetes bacterium]|nr:pantothenate kinase [Gemmatimonadota bacterium]
MVQLVADVGNTETVFGLLDMDGRAVHAHWRVSTQVPRT